MTTPLKDTIVLRIVCNSLMPDIGMEPEDKRLFPGSCNSLVCSYLSVVSRVLRSISELTGKGAGLTPHPQSVLKRGTCDDSLLQRP
jgi:hypothetical protein